MTEILSGTVRSLKIVSSLDDFMVFAHKLDFGIIGSEIPLLDVFEDLIIIGADFLF